MPDKFMDEAVEIDTAAGNNIDIPDVDFYNQKVEKEIYLEEQKKKMEAALKTFYGRD